MKSIFLFACGVTLLLTVGCFFPGHQHGEYHHHQEHYAHHEHSAPPVYVQPPEPSVDIHIRAQ